MARLTILRGVSGSGKSTWASQQKAVVVSRDSIRLNLYGSDGPDYYAADRDTLRVREDRVTHTHDALIKGFLKDGEDVIVDNTHIEWRYVETVARLGWAVDAEVEVKVFDVPLAQAIYRNDARAEGGGRRVPEYVITKQYYRLQETKDMVLPERTG